MKQWLPMGLAAPLLVLFGTIGVSAATDNITNLVFTLAPTALTAGSGERFEVEFRNANNQAESLSSNETLELVSSAATGEFSDATEASCGGDWSLTSLPFSDGSVRRSFCYRDTVNGSATLTAQIPGRAWPAVAAAVTVSGGVNATTSATSTDDGGGTATTTDDTVAPQVTAMIPANISDHSADIMLSLTEPATAVVWYATGTPVLEHQPAMTAPSSSPTISLTGLDPSTRYYFFAAVSDSAGNTSTSSTQSFRTKSATASSTDVTAPMVTAAYPLDTTSSSTRLVVETNEAPVSWMVTYGLDSALSDGEIFTSDEVRSQATSSSVRLGSLTASSTYFYYVTVWDDSANESRSSTQSFATLMGEATSTPDTSGNGNNNNGNDGNDDEQSSGGGSSGGSTRRARLARAAANQGQVLGAFTGTPSGAAAIGLPNTGGYVFTNNLTTGSQGAEVSALQQRLASEGVYAGPVTGFFGPLTEAAVRAYQMSQGITPTGFVGPLTRAALNREVSAAGNSRAELVALQARLQQLWDALAALSAQSAEAATGSR